MQPLVSILIPAYNAEALLAETLSSAVGQTWSRKEIIVVDDGSSDQTLSIARGFAAGNVSVITQSNEGAAAARNKAFSVCQGDYIQWLDADDVLAPGKIARQMEAAEKIRNNRLLLLSAWGSFFYRAHRARFNPTELWCDLPPVEWLIRKFETGHFMQTATWLVSRELTAAAGAWDTRLLGDDDGEYFCRVALASERIRFVPDAKVYYRVPGPKSLSYIGNSDRKIEAQFLSMEMNIRHLRGAEESQRVRNACVKYLQCFLPCFYPERPDIVDKARLLATSLGGHLVTPRLSWKYAWLQKLFGWPFARRSQLSYNRLKLRLRRSWDGLLSLSAGKRLANEKTS